MAHTTYWLKTKFRIKFNSTDRIPSPQQHGVKSWEFFRVWKYIVIPGDTPGLLLVYSWQLPFVPWGSSKFWDACGGCPFSGWCLFFSRRARCHFSPYNEDARNSCGNRNRWIIRRSVTAPKHYKQVQYFLQPYLHKSSRLEPHRHIFTINLSIKREGYT